MRRDVRQQHTRVCRHHSVLVPTCLFGEVCRPRRWRPVWLCLLFVYRNLESRQVLQQPGQCAHYLAGSWAPRLDLVGGSAAGLTRG